MDMQFSKSPNWSDCEFLSAKGKRAPTSVILLEGDGDIDNSLFECISIEKIEFYNVKKNNTGNPKSRQEYGLTVRKLGILRRK